MDQISFSLVPFPRELLESFSSNLMPFFNKYTVRFGMHFAMVAYMAPDHIPILISTPNFSYCFPEAHIAWKIDILGTKVGRRI